MQDSSAGKKRWHLEPLPEARLVAPNIWKFTLPIPFPLRTVNMYAIVGEYGEWAVIDAGMGIPDARTALRDGLRKAGLRIGNLRTIVLSHDHPDHIGLSGELREKSGATVYMHSIDAEGMRTIWSGSAPAQFRSVSQFFRQHGMPVNEQWFSSVPADEMRNVIRVPLYEELTLVEDGQYLDILGEQYRVIWTPGHSDGHICLFRERDGVFIAADHVLPRITPNVGLYSENDRANPLGDYLNSLRKVQNLPASIVLPGHSEPFTDLAGRVQEIIEHHEDREQQILSLFDKQPRNAYYLTEKLFGQRLKSNEARRMAVAETLAHLEYMRYESQVEQYKTNDGLIMYEVV